VTDEVSNDVVETILESAGTGEIGDGKIFLTKIDNSIRIRTREAGDVAIG